MLASGYAELGIYIYIFFISTALFVLWLNHVVLITHSWILFLNFSTLGECSSLDHQEWHRRLLDTLLVLFFSNLESINFLFLHQEIIMQQSLVLSSTWVEIEDDDPVVFGSESEEDELWS